MDRRERRPKLVAQYVEKLVLRLVFPDACFDQPSMHDRQGAYICQCGEQVSGRARQRLYRASVHQEHTHSSPVIAERERYELPHPQRGCTASVNGGGKRPFLAQRHGVRTTRGRKVVHGPPCSTVFLQLLRRQDRVYTQGDRAIKLIIVREQVNRCHASIAKEARGFTRHGPCYRVGVRGADNVCSVMLKSRCSGSNVSSCPPAGVGMKAPPCSPAMKLLLLKKSCSVVFADLRRNR